MRTLCKGTVGFLIVLTISVGSATAQSYLEQLERGFGGLFRDQPRNPQAADEVATPAYLGLLAHELDPPGTGVVIVNVYPGGPADDAGLREGDVVISVERTPVRNLNEMADAVERFAPGAPIQFTVQRDGELHSLRVTAGARPTQEPASGAGQPDERLPLPREAPAARDVRSRPTLGVTVVEATEDVRGRYGLTVQRGAVITAIQPASPADRAGLPLGAVIVSADGQRVDDTRDLLDILAQAQVGQEIELGYYAGNELVRRNVLLTAAPPQREERLLPPRDGAPLLDGLRSRGGRRPVLDGLGRVLDDITDQPGGPAANDGRALDEIGRLYEQLDRMQQRIDDLERRLAELETEQ